jgi:SH3-like domain-containing protein
MIATVKRVLLSLWLILALGVTIQGAMAQSSTEARLRFVHAIPDATAVDVYTDGQLTISGLDYGQASTYAFVPVGDHQITVTPTGATNSVWQQTVNVGNGAALTLVAASTSSPTFLVYPEDLSPIALGKARLTAIHAIAGGPSIDLLLTDGRLVLPGVQFGQPASTLDIPTFGFDFAIVPSGQGVETALTTLPTLPLTTSTSYMLLVYGTLDEPETLLLSTPTTSDAEGGLVRVAHGVSGAPPVDVYMNDTLVVPSLAFGTFTEHVAIPAGTYNVAIRAAGSDQNLLTGTLPVESGQALTVAALGTPDQINVNVFTDNIGGLDAANARLSLINAVPGDGTISASLENGTSLADNLTFGSVSEAVTIAPSTRSIQVQVLSGDEPITVEIPSLNFYGGVYYNLLAVSDNGEVKLLSAPTSLAQGIASAPGASAIVVAAAPTVEPTLPPPPAVEPTMSPTEVPVVPTTAPAATAGPTARVFNLDADRNLQLRQYPDSNSLSLGTIPPGTIVLLNGRAGAIEDIPFSATPRPPEGYEFVDPASLLTDPKEDLDPAATWLNVTYNTPDGGSITAWANGLYLDIRNPRGERIKLASLPLVASNLPGEATNTGVTGPSIPANRVAAIAFNLDVDVNLNIRRIADPNSEVLARVPSGTIMEFLGIKEDREWVFVRYTPPEGGEITGWVSALYVQYTFNDRPIDLDEIEERELLVITPDETRGEVTAGIAPAAIPTVNPVKDNFVAEVVLDQGSNLNLRRTPNANSEVLARLPSGTQVIVTSRTGDGQWLFVTFEDITGWIAARTEVATFVRLTFNARPANIEDVPVSTGESGTAVIPPTPTGDANLTQIPVRVTDSVVAMTGSPGGDNQGLPILTAGQEAILLFTDGIFSYIELPDGIRGWVPAGAVQPR